MQVRHGVRRGITAVALGATAIMAALAGQPAAAQQGARSTASLPASGSAGSLAALPPAGTIEIARQGDSRPPIGWVQFCGNRAYAAECAIDTDEPEKVELTPRLWRLVTNLNARVNRDIDPVTDMDQWGVVERWDMAESGRGDCEEYVNIKRRQLVEAGVPRRALRVVVVIDDENAGHAVLMLRTDRGDYILDNKRNAVLPWHQTGYIYVKRESQDRVGWVPLGGVGGVAVATR
jgi:predicted transglutaminase-like cysteine proteinase